MGSGLPDHAVGVFIGVICCCIVASVMVNIGIGGVYRGDIWLFPKELYLLITWENHLATTESVECKQERISSISAVLT